MPKDMVEAWLQPPLQGKGFHVRQPLRQQQTLKGSTFNQFELRRQLQQNPERRREGKEHQH